MRHMVGNIWRVINFRYFGFVFVISTFLFSESVTLETSWSLFAPIAILVSMASTALGRWVVDMARLDVHFAPMLSSFILGTVVLSALLMFASFVLNIPILIAFFLIFVISITYLFFSKNKFKEEKENFAELKIAFLFAILVFLFCRIPVSALSALKNEGIFPIWSDYFIHGITIASFGSEFMTGGDLELAGTARVFYHYIPFMIPAVFQSATGSSGISIALSVLLPLSLLTATYGVLSLFSCLCGIRFAGVLALVAMLVLATSPIIQSGWMDFYWLSFIAPGSGYALGLSLMIMTSIINFDEHRPRILSLVFLLFLLFFTRAQFFLLLFPVTAITVALGYFKINVSGKLFIFFLFTFVFSVLIGIEVFELGRFGKPVEYLHHILSSSRFYGNEFKVTHIEVLDIAILVCVSAVALPAGGVVTYIPLLIYKIKKFGASFIDYCAYLLLLFFLLFVIFAPEAVNGQLDEYKHRHFLLVSAALVIYAIYYIYLIINNNYPRLLANIEKFWFPICTCIIIILSMLSFGYRVNLAQPDINSMVWAAEYHGARVNPALVMVSDFLKSNAKLGSVFTMSPVSSSDTSGAPAVSVIISMSGVPAYVSRPNLKKMRSNDFREQVEYRLGIIGSLISAENKFEFDNIMQSNCIRWLILVPGESLKWDKGRSKAVFEYNGYRIYTGRG